MDVAVHERLRLARERSGQSRAALSRRIGVGEKLLEAIDDGRLGDLPSGLYARAAVRRYAQALAIDPDEALAGCAALLPMPEDPVSALARLQGLRPAAPDRVTPAPAPAAPPARAFARVPRPGPAPFPPWRPLAALAADGALVGAVLFAAVVGAVLLSGTGPSAAGRPSAVIYGLLGVVLSSCYFVFFGGIACTTAGERLIGMRVGRRAPRHINPAAVAVRAARCWGRDIRYLTRLGAWAGSVLWTDTPGAGRAARSIGHAAGQ